MTSEKIALVLDTNILEKNWKKVPDDFSCFLLEIYEETKEMIERVYLGDEVDIFIPEIVLLELSSHKIDRLNKRLEILEKMTKEFDDVNEIEIKIDEDFLSKNHVNNIKGEIFDDLNLIEIPEDWSLLFDRVLNMALYKIPPFERGKGKSDKGFKDAILLLSIINFAHVVEYDKFVLFSTDGVFPTYQELIKKFFHDETSKTLEIQGNKNIQGYILDKYDIYIDFQEYLNEFFVEIESELDAKNQIVLESEGIVCNIEKFEISSDNTVIKQVSDIEYDLNVAFKLTYKCKGVDELKSIDDINKEYTFKKENEEWALIKEKEFNYKIF